MRVVGILLIAAVLACGCTSKTAVGPPPIVIPSVASTATTAFPAATATSTPTTSPSSQGPAQAAIPAGFSPLSVTFISLRTGWVLGASCATCTVTILRTRDGGASWARIPGPPIASAQLNVLGAEKIRFANLNDGWVVGPDLWETHDGGTNWAKVVLPVRGPAQVSDLAASAGAVRAVVLDGTNVFDIVSSPTGRDAWQVSATKLPVGAGPVPTAQIVLQGSGGWVLQNDRTVVNGARLSGDAWVPWPPPQAVGGPAFLAASGARDLVAAASEGVWTGPPTGIHVFVSSDGVTLHRVASTVPAVSLDAIAAPAAGVMVLSGESPTARELVASFDGGVSWTPVLQVEGQGAWQDLGFTSPEQGMVIETGADAQPGQFLMTHDGGRSWAPVPFTTSPS